MPLTLKNINNFTQWKKMDQCDVNPRAITHQKHLAQSGRSTQSAVDIFNTLHVFKYYLLTSQSENKKLSWRVWIQCIC